MFIGATLLVLMAGILLTVIKIPLPERVLQISDSPDNKYRCIVRETRPPWPTYSPYLYSFTLYQKRSNLELKGKNYIHNSDSGPRQSFIFDWSENRLEVSYDYNQAVPRSSNVLYIVTAVIKDDSQIWAYQRATTNKGAQGQ